MIVVSRPLSFRDRSIDPVSISVLDFDSLIIVLERLYIESGGEEIQI